MTEKIKSIILHYNTGRNEQIDGVTEVKCNQDHYLITLGRATVAVQRVSLKLHNPIEEVTIS